MQPARLDGDVPPVGFRAFYAAKDEAGRYLSSWREEHDSPISVNPWGGRFAEPTLVGAQTGIQKDVCEAQLAMATARLREYERFGNCRRDAHRICVPGSDHLLKGVLRDRLMEFDCVQASRIDLGRCDR
ncbi:MAG: hypothetical protein V7607_5870 [Solirubrobacteraceae bacterium]